MPRCGDDTPAQRGVRIVTDVGDIGFCFDFRNRASTGNFQRHHAGNGVFQVIGIRARTHQQDAHKHTQHSDFFHTQFLL